MTALDGHRRTHPDPVGRGTERRLLTETCQDVRAGYGHLVLIGGEAGIGKTTLVERFLSDIRADDVVVLFGSCYDVESPPAYAPWREALSGSCISPPVAANGPAEWFDDRHLAGLNDQATLFHDVLHGIRGLAERRTVIIVLEDVHWADRESLELLRFLSRSIRDDRICIVVTYRNDEISNADPLHLALPNLMREARAERIDLRRFNGSTLRQLVSSRYRFAAGDLDRLVDELDRKTDGNPLFVVELLRSMEMSGIISENGACWHVSEFVEIEIPLLVRHLIERRLQLLDDQARDVLQVAAIIGHEVRPDILTAVTGESSERLSACVQQAVDAFLLEQLPGRSNLRFRHALVQETLYSSIPLVKRQSIHRAIGEFLTSNPGAEPAIIAEHFRLGVDPRATRWAVQSARHSRRLYAPHAVIQHLNPVLEHPEMLESDERIEAFRLRGWAHEMIGDFRAADRDYLAELQYAIDGEDRHAERDALVRLAELWTYRDYQRVSQYIEQALQITADIDDSLLLAQSHNRFGTWYMSQDDPESAREHHLRALEICLTISGQHGIAETYDLLGLSLTLAGDLTAADENYSRARSHYQSMNNLTGIASTGANFAHLGPTYLTDTAVTPVTLDECIRASREALKIASEIDYQTGSVYARVRLSASLGARGSYRAALDMVRSGIEEAEQVGNRQLLSAAHSMAGLLWLDLFNIENARYHAERSLHISEQVGSIFRIRMSAAILAMSQLAAGDYSGAEAQLQPVWPGDTPARSLAQHLLWRARIELELARGNADAALHAVDALLGVVPHASRSTPALRLSLLRGRALNELGRFDEAIAWLKPARDSSSQQGARALLWRIHRELGMVWFGCGERLQASRAFSEARGIVEEIGQSIAESEVQDRFVDLGLSYIPEPDGPTPLQSAKMSAGGLTRRQRQVAMLIADGLSNRAIAERFCISERTVESHVSAILSTLGLTSRTQIVAWCLERGLTTGSTASPS